MLNSILSWVTQYGLLVVFLLVFLQETGIPSPVPNELILLFAGYQASTGRLSLTLLFVVAVAGDFIGTSALYFIFYFFGSRLLMRFPKWFPPARVEYWRNRISGQDHWGIYVGRLVPYARAYVSVVAGSLRVRPKIFMPAVFLSAITWSGGYVILGRLLGPAWVDLASKLRIINWVALILITAVILYFIVPRIYRRLKH